MDTTLFVTKAYDNRSGLESLENQANQSQFWAGLSTPVFRWVFRWRVILLVAGLMFGGVSVSHAQSGEAAVRLSDDVVVRKLAEGVWLHTTYFDISGLRRVPANGLVVIDGRDAIMIDLPWTDEQTGVLFDWASRAHNAAIKKVVATHSHIDCAGGLAEAHRRGADSFAMEKTAAI